MRSPSPWLVVLFFTISSVSPAGADPAPESPTAAAERTTARRLVIAGSILDVLCAAGAAMAITGGVEVGLGADQSTTDAAGPIAWSLLISGLVTSAVFCPVGIGLTVSGVRRQHALARQTPALALAPLFATHDGHPLLGAVATLVLRF